MKVMLDEGAYMPTRAHSTDAGLDLYSPVDVMIMPNASAVIDTGVHVELPYGSVGFLKAKSGLNVKHGILGAVQSQRRRILHPARGQDHPACDPAGNFAGFGAGG